MKCRWCGNEHYDVFGNGFCSTVCKEQYCDPTSKPIKEYKATRALGVQVGGDHYKNMKIQVVEYCMANNIPYMEGNIIKYVSRWKAKGGIDDLRKAKHYLELLIESEEKIPITG